MVFRLVYHTIQPHFHQPRTLAPIDYLSFDCVTMWYMCKRCSFRCSFTSHCAICDPNNICWVISKHAQFSALCHINSANSDLIANWTMGGERASKTASFTYRSYRDTIRTHILNWRQGSEIAKMWNQPKNRGFSAFRSFDGVEPMATVLVRFQPGPGTNPPIWTRCYC